MKNVLFICTGNTCRSPMAEAILRHKGGHLYNVKSAGVFAIDGQSAHPNAIEVLKDNGITINHSSKALTNDLVEWADVILTMTEGHKNSLLQNFPDAIQKTATLSGYLTGDKDWQKWKEAMADYQMKKAMYTGAKQTKKDDLYQESELYDAYDRIQELENSITNADIADPFGGTKEVYQECFNQLDKLIEQMIKDENDK